MSRVERRPKWWWFLPAAAARIRIWVSTCWQSRSRSAKKIVVAFYGAERFFLDFGGESWGWKIPAFLLSSDLWTSELVTPGNRGPGGLG